MIYLYTGKPGAGKTLCALVDFVAMLRKEDDVRPAYVCGVDGLKTDHPDLEGLDIQVLERAEDWPTLPDGSLVFIDEVQRFLRPRRSGGAIAEYQAGLETHRHRGMDFFFTTQGVHLLDGQVHPLVDRHVHLHRGSHREGCWRYEWAEAKRSPRGETAKDSAEVAKRQPFNKKAYDWYTSAEVHTHKRRIPWRLLRVVSIPILLISFMIWNASSSQFVRSWFGFDEPPGVDASETVGDELLQDDRGNGYIASTDRAETKKRKLEDMTWQEMFRPAEDGKPWSAPIFRRSFTSGAVLPVPQCVQLEPINDTGDCRCYSQQGTRLEGVSLASCMYVVRYGFYDPRGRSGAGEDAPPTTSPRPSSL